MFSTQLHEIITKWKHQDITERIFQKPATLNIVLGRVCSQTQLWQLTFNPLTWKTW